MYVYSIYIIFIRLLNYMYMTYDTLVDCDEIQIRITIVEYIIGMNSGRHDSGVILRFVFERDC